MVVSLEKYILINILFLKKELEELGKTFTEFIHELLILTNETSVDCHLFSLTCLSHTTTDR